MAGGGEGVSSAFYLPRLGLPFQLRGAPRRAPPGPPKLFPNCPDRRWARGDSAKGLGLEGAIVCLNTRSLGPADVDPKRVAIEVSPIPLPLRPAHPLPPWSCTGEEKPRFGTTLAFTFLGGYSPRLDMEDSSFFFSFCFYFWRGAPSNCPEHMLLPPSFLQPPATESPLFCIYHFPSPFFIKGPGVAAANQRSASIL